MSRINELTDAQWSAIIQTAYENLPQGTLVGDDDIDSILTWCIPEYEAVLEEIDRSHE